jgi:hypothetical protein
MEERHILLIEQDDCRFPYHEFDTLDKINREANYRAEPG